MSIDPHTQNEFLQDENFVLRSKLQNSESEVERLKYKFNFMLFFFLGLFFWISLFLLIYFFTHG